MPNVILLVRSKKDYPTVTATIRPLFAVAGSNPLSSRLEERKFWHLVAFKTSKWNFTKFYDSWSLIGRMADALLSQPKLCTSVQLNIIVKCRHWHASLVTWQWQTSQLCSQIQDVGLNYLVPWTFQSACRPDVWCLFPIRSSKVSEWTKNERCKILTKIHSALEKMINTKRTHCIGEIIEKSEN